MKPVFQEIIDNDLDKGVVGDCLPAAVASLLELPLSEVPHFFQDHWPDIEGGRAALDNFLASKGITLVHMSGTDFIRWAPVGDIYHLIVGETREEGGAADGEPLMHAVIGLNGRVVHDPTPNSHGLPGCIDDWRVILFVANDPSSISPRQKETAE